MAGRIPPHAESLGGALQQLLHRHTAGPRLRQNLAKGPDNRALSRHFRQFDLSLAGRKMQHHRRRRLALKRRVFAAKQAVAMRPPRQQIERLLEQDRIGRQRCQLFHCRRINPIRKIVRQSRLAQIPQPALARPTGKLREIHRIADRREIVERQDVRALARHVAAHRLEMRAMRRARSRHVRERGCHRRHGSAQAARRRISRQGPDQGHHIPPQGPAGQRIVADADDPTVRNHLAAQVEDLGLHGVRDPGKDAVNDQKVAGMRRTPMLQIRHFKADIFQAGRISRLPGRADRRIRVVQPHEVGLRITSGQRQQVLARRTAKLDHPRDLRQSQSLQSRHPRAHRQPRNIRHRMAQRRVAPFRIQLTDRVVHGTPLTSTSGLWKPRNTAKPQKTGLFPSRSSYPNSLKLLSGQEITLSERQFPAC